MKNPANSQIIPQKLKEKPTLFVANPAQTNKNNKQKKNNLLKYSSFNFLSMRQQRFYLALLIASM